VYYLDEVKILRNKLNARRNAGEHAKCVFLGEKLIQLHRKNKNTRSMNFADDLFNLAMVYEDMEKLERARVLYVDSLRLIQALLGEGTEYADRLTNLAVVSGKMGKHSVALAMFSKAEQIKLAKLGEYSPEAACAMHNLANCMFDQGLYERALEKHKQALAIREHNHSSGDTDGRDIAYADSLNACGYCHESLEQESEAEGYFLRAMDVTADVCGEESEEYVSGLLYYADFLCDNGRGGAAFKKYNKALRIFKKLYEDKSMKYAGAISTVANGFERAGDLKKALSLKITAIEMMRGIVGGDHLHFANTYKDIAIGFHSLGDVGNAIKNMRKALKIKQSTIGRMDDSYVRDLLALSLFYLEQLEYKHLAGTLKSVLKGVDPDDPKIPPYYKGLRELCFLASEMAKLQSDIDGNSFTSKPLSEDLKKIEALSTLLKLISENLS